MTLQVVAWRHNFDGYGWDYVDNGHGSNWLDRHLTDGEKLVTLSDAQAEIDRLREVLRVARDALKYSYNACESEWVQDEKIDPAIAAIDAELKGEV